MKRWSLPLALLIVLGLDLFRARADFVSLAPAPQVVAADDTLCDLLGLDRSLLASGPAPAAESDGPADPLKRSDDLQHRDDAGSAPSSSHSSAGGCQAALHSLPCCQESEDSQAHRRPRESALAILMRDPLFRPPCR